MKKYQLAVLGGGLAGIGAAVAAARQGLDVVIIEREGILGGALITQSVFPFMAFSTYDVNAKEMKYTAKGIFTEIIREQQKLDRDTTNSVAGYKKEYIKFALDKMVTEAGVDVLFHTTVYDVVTDGRNIKKVLATACGEKLEIEADYFIDASGDGNLLYLAGCEYIIGREKDNLCQPMTTCFDMCGVDIEQYERDVKDLQKLYNEKQKAGEITNPRENILVFYGLDLGENIIHFNTTRVVKHNPVNPFELSEAEMIARKQILEMVNFLKENSHAFDHATLVNSANHIGVRESRKLVGEYVLTGQDLLNMVRFPDTIALGCYCIDIHNPEGTGTTIHDFKPGEYYCIPYRSLVPKEYDNMLVAGRCLSANQEAHSAVRVMPTCCSMGEAAGVAVSVAAKAGVGTNKVDVQKVREILRKNDAPVD